MDQSQEAAAAGIDAIGGARNAYGELLSTLGKRPLNSTEMAAATQLVQGNDLTVDEKTILLTQVMESATDMGQWTGFRRRSHLSVSCGRSLGRKLILHSGKNNSML